MLAELSVSRERVQRWTKRIGRERVAETEAQAAAYQELTLPARRTSPTEQVPQVACVMADGGRIQIRARGRCFRRGRDRLLARDTGGLLPEHDEHDAGGGPLSDDPLDVRRPGANLPIGPRNQGNFGQLPRRGRVSGGRAARSPWPSDAAGQERRGDATRGRSVRHAVGRRGLRAGGFTPRRGRRSSPMAPRRIGAFTSGTSRTIRRSSTSPMRSVTSTPRRTPHAARRRAGRRIANGPSGCGKGASKRSWRRSRLGPTSWDRQATRTRRRRRAASSPRRYGI